MILRSISAMFSGVQGADQDAKDEGFSEESKGKLSLVYLGLFLILSSKETVHRITVKEETPSNLN